MKHYFYAENDQQLGPFNIEELKTKLIKKSTLIWTEGLQDWTNASEIEELKDILISEPPPIPKKANLPPKIETIQIKKSPLEAISTKYDMTYKKENDATFFGIVLFAIPIILSYSGIINLNFVEIDSQIMLMLFFISLMTRIAITVMVNGISRRQNRNPKWWNLFAILSPSITLIVLGQLKKLRLKIILDGSLPINEQVSILIKKANEFYNDKRNSECVEILSKAIELDNNNFESLKLRGIAYYNQNNYEKAKTDFETLLKNEKFASITNYYLGNIAIHNKNRELAVSYWLKADDLNNESAKIKLDFFNTFTGNYLLDTFQIMRKVSNNSSVQMIYFGAIKYHGGLSQIDQNEPLNSLQAQITIYELGLHIEITRTFKTIHVGIAYYEIKNIVFIEETKKFELILVDNNILNFSYDQTKDYNKGLKKICYNFKSATGHTPNASASWSE